MVEYLYNDLMNFSCLKAGFIEDHQLLKHKLKDIKNASS